MIVFPNAKINLGLNVVSRREDGYHSISSCFLPIGWKDILEVIEAPVFEFSSSGLEIPGDAQNNLCVRAFEMLKKDFDIPSVKIHLHKLIPMGAGLGGGSSDGAFTLMILNDLFELKISTAKLTDYAKRLGADCPFFLRNRPTMVSGIGEIFGDIDVDLSGVKVVVVHPDIHINTAKAFEKIIPNEPIWAIPDVLVSPRTAWLEGLKNDFEEPAIQEFSTIQTIKNELTRQGAFYTSMTGSGSAVFGLFETTCDHVRLKDYMIWAGEL